MWKTEKGCTCSERFVLATPTRLSNFVSASKSALVHNKQAAQRGKDYGAWPGDITVTIIIIIICSLASTARSDTM